MRRELQFPKHRVLNRRDRGPDGTLNSVPRDQGRAAARGPVDPREMPGAVKRSADKKSYPGPANMFDSE